MGVGPGSSSRDAANWLSSSLSRSVETRRRYGWLGTMVFPDAHLSEQLQFGALRELAAREGLGGHCRGEPGSALSGGYVPNSVAAEGNLIVDEPGEY